MGVRYSTPKSAFRQPDDQTLEESGSARYSCDSRLLNFSKINNKNGINNSSPAKSRKNSPILHRSASNPIGSDSSTPSSASSLLSCRPNSNSCLDPMLYVNINSPGFVSRVVDSADQSADSTITGQSRYNGVGRFPRVQLGGPSPLPTLSSKNSQKFGKGTVHVRIAPPSSANQFERRRSSSCSDPDKSFKSVLESLQEKSRKRIYSQCQETEDYNIKKKQRKGEGSFTETNRDDQLYRLSRSASMGSPNAVLQIIDPVLQAKRAREEESPTESLKRQKKRVVTYNNEILSSLSSSRGLLKRLSTNKRKTAECEGSNTNALNKQFKENVDLSSPRSPPRWVHLTKNLKENSVVSPRTTAPRSLESVTRTQSRDEEVVMKLLDEEEEEEESSHVSEATPKKTSRVSILETDTPKISNKQENVDMSSKLFRKNGTVKAKPRAAPSSPWAHAAPASDELTCSLDKNRDKALERPQRFHGLLARMRGDGPPSTTNVSIPVPSPSSSSKPTVNATDPFSVSTPPSKMNEKKPSATPFTITSASAAVVGSLASTSTMSLVSSTSTVVSTSSPSLPALGGINSFSSKPGFGGFPRSSTINTGSVSSLFGSDRTTLQASPKALTSTTCSGSRPLSSPVSSPKHPTSESDSTPASSATATGTSTVTTAGFATVTTSGSAAASTAVSPNPSVVSFGSSLTTSVPDSTSKATLTPDRPKSSFSSTSIGFGVPTATSAAPTFNFGSVASAPTTSSTPTSPPTTVLSTSFSTPSTLSSNEEAKPAVPSFQFGASNQNLPAGGIKFPGVTSALTSASTPSTLLTSTPSTLLTSTPSTFLKSTTSTLLTSTPSTLLTSTPSTLLTSTPSTLLTSTPSTLLTSTPSTMLSATPATVSSAAPPTPALTFSFGSSTPSATSKFGSAIGSTQPKSGGTPATTSAPTFGSGTLPTFGSPTPNPATSAQPTPVFSGASSQLASPSFGTPSNMGLNFGSTTGATSAPTFGATSSAAPPTPAFGATGAAAAATPTTTISAPIFGSTTPAPTFGATSAATPLFGALANSTAPNSNAPTSANGVLSFGSGTPAPAPAFGATFNSGAAATSSTSTSVFGSPAPSTASNSNAPAFQFGGSSTSQPTFNFGGGSSQSTSGPSQGFNFSASTGTRAFQFNASGALSASGAPVTTAPPTFGASSNSSTATAPGNTFGALTFGATQTSSPSFGATTSAFGAPQSGGMFGSTSPQPSTSVFGAATGGGPTFGSAAPPPAFGTTPIPAFGAAPVAAPAAAAPAPAFGAASTSSTSNSNAPAFQFGAPSTAPAPTFNFSAGLAQSTAGPSQGFNFSATQAPPTFQFNANGPTTTPTPGAGMFHIGAGSSNPSQRPRQTARRRK